MTPPACRPLAAAPLGWLLLASILASSLALAGCSTGPAASAVGPSPVASPSVTRGPLTSPSGSPIPGAVPDEILHAALADASGRSGVDPADITVVSTDATVWNSGALGCPEPGKLYTQALVPGYRIVLEAGGKTFDYRATESGNVKLCEGGGALSG